MTRKCAECGSPMTVKAENHRYGESGLDNVTLIGVPVWRCSHCGEWEVEIRNVEGLHRLLAYLLARKAARLTPQEIRFLRTYLGLSSADFARRMGVAKQTVSRWERVDEPLAMKTGTERFLRLMSLHEQPAQTYELADLDGTATTEPRAAHVRAVVRNHGEWREQRA